MSRVKINVSTGGIIDKPLLTCFQGTGGNYLVLDNEANGSMGLPIICISKFDGNNLIKIIDQAEWAGVKESLKSIISGKAVPYLNVPETVNANEDFYTQLTLPVASFDLLKSVYAPAAPVEPAAPAPAPEAPAPEAAPAAPEAAPQNGEVVPPAPAAPEMPAMEAPTSLGTITMPEIPAVTPAETAAPVVAEPAPVESTPAPVPAAPEMPAMPTMPEIPAAPALETPAPAPVEPAMPVVPTVETAAPVVPEIAPVVEAAPAAPEVVPAIPDMAAPVEPAAPEAPAENQIDISAPVVMAEPLPDDPISMMVPDPNATEVPVAPETNADAIAIPTQEMVNDTFVGESDDIQALKENFMKSCETMFDALIKKFENKK